MKNLVQRSFLLLIACIAFAEIGCGITEPTLIPPPR